MKKSLLLTIVILVLCKTSFAYDFSAVSPSGHTLYYNIVQGHAEVVRPGSVYTYNNYVTGNVIIPASVSYGNSTYVVTALMGDSDVGTFSGCSGLTSITIPNTVTTIGSHAFRGCTGLTSIIIPDSVRQIGNRAFLGCTGLTSVTIPNAVLTIGDWAFKGCTGLTSVVFNADSCMSAGPNYFDRAFYGCPNINSFVFGNTVKVIPAYICYTMDSLTSVTIPNTVTSIGGSAFSGCTRLTSVIIPDAVVTIGGYAFNGCTGLTSATIGNSVRSIGEQAFYNCTGLTSVVFNADSCTYAGEYNNNNDSRAFKGCSNITNFTFGNNVKVIPTYLCFGMNRLNSVTIGNSVTSIGGGAFRECTGLTSVVFNADSCTSCTSAGTNDRAFYGCLNINSFVFGNNVKVIPDSLCYDMYRLTSISIPDSVTSIGNRAFSGCTGLTSVVFNADSCTSAGSGNNTRAFYGCSNITNFTFGIGVKVIPAYLCYGLNRLTSVTIPNSFTTVGEFAFYDCTGLTGTLPASLTTVGTYAFFHCTGLTGTLPAGLTSIGICAFSGCSGLTGPLTLPVGLTTIPYEAFSGCTGLTSVTIPNSVTSIGSYAFGYCSGLTSASIGNSVMEIGICVFNNCTSLKSVVFSSDSCTSANAAFVYCDSLTSIVFTNNVKNIPGDMFGSENSVWPCNNSLTSVTIGSSVVRIGYYAFVNCCALDSVFLLPHTPPTIYGGNFCFYGNAHLCIHCGDYANYISAGGGWSDRIYVNYYYPDINVNLSSNDTSQGSVSSILQEGRIVSCDSTTIIQATASQGYHFSHWNDGNTSNPRTITLTQDTSFIAYFDRNTYYVIGTSSQAARGYVTGSDTVYYLDTVILTAIANYGYHFQRWNDNNTDNPRAIVATGNITKSVVFAPNQYTITLNVDTATHGTCTGAGSYNYLSSRTIRATASQGYHFVQWSDGVTSNPRTISLTQDTTFTAQFARNQYTVTGISNNEDRGSVYGSDTVYYLDSVTLTATANYGYHFLRWNDNNTDNPRIVVATGNINLTAIFDYNQYTISVNADTAIHGTCTGGGSFSYLSTHTIQSNANYGYHFTQWSDGDTSNPRSITLTQDTSFTAYFGRNNYQISVLSDNDTMGSATGSASALYLDSITISATANYGYLFSHWNDSATTNPRTVQVTEDKIYTAYFSYDQFSLTVQSDNPTHGSVNGAGRYDYLSSRTITATANYGYHFIYWNDGVTENPRSITLTQDSSFTAYFAPNQYTLTVNAGEHGTTSGSGTYSYGDTITIQASPEEHYHFTRWNDGNLDNPRQYVIEADITLTAFFAIDTHTVNVVANDIARGMVETSGTSFTYGSPCTVTATAYTSYTFVGWSNGVTANPYTFAVMEDVELSAIFLSPDEMVTITAESGNPSMGTATVNGTNSVTVMPGEEVTLTATPFGGYRFVRWQDNDTSATRTVTTTSNITYTAYFERNVGISEADGDALFHHVYADGGRIVVAGAEGERVCLYDITGRLLATQQDAGVHGGTPLRFDVPSVGVYLIHIGDAEVHKVAVVR